MSSAPSLPTVSVILVTYNQEAFVAEAVRSWLRQDLADFELILSDDASTDRTREVIDAELAQHPDTSVRVVHCHRPRNGGVLANINAAMAACSGDIIIAAAGDDVSEPSRVRLTIEIFAADPTVQAVVTNCQKIDAEGRPIGAPELRHRTGRYAYDLEPRDIYARSPVCGASAAYRASLFRDFGPMQPGSHGEDNCFWVRALLRGAVYYDRRPLVLWRQHGANLSNYSEGGFASAENRQRHLRWMRAHELMTPQWERDVALAVERGWVSPERGALVVDLARRECARWKLDRCSLEPAPWAEWKEAARVLLRPGQLSFVYRGFRKWVSRGRREREWRWWAKVRQQS
jgi:glycosyltransferase involved in cell wall biosynthesis